VAAGNRLTEEQLAALAPGDTVTIETGSGFGRSRHTTGTVVRTGRFHVVVSVAGPRGGTFIERYSVRYGVRDSGGPAALVATDTDNPATRNLLRRRTQRIDTAYRQWSRRRDDVEALQELRDAISDYMAETLTSSGAATPADLRRGTRPSGTERQGRTFSAEGTRPDSMKASRADRCSRTCLPSLT
jgi:hypothetical protein